MTSLRLRFVRLSIALVLTGAACTAPPTTSNTRAADAAPPSPVAVAPTTVVHTWPSAAVVPANLLRIYIEFSAPMGREDGLEYVRLFDDEGPVPSPFVPGRPDAWNAERTIYSLYLNPGRRRPDDEPGQSLGFTLHPDHRYTLEVDARWPDASGRTLAMGFRQTFQAGPPLMTAVDPRKWQFAAPGAGRRDAAIVTFPAALDAGLLRRALGIAREDGTPIAGTIRIDPGEARWNFTPDEPWRPGRYNLLVMSTLEDPAGNRIGRLFDSAWLEDNGPTAPANQTKMPFEIK